MPKELLLEISEKADWTAEVMASSSDFETCVGRVLVAPLTETHLGDDVESWDRPVGSLAPAGVVVVIECWSFHKRTRVLRQRILIRESSVSIQIWNSMTSYPIFFPRSRGGFICSLWSFSLGLPGNQSSPFSLFRMLSWEFVFARLWRPPVFSSDSNLKISFLKYSSSLSMTLFFTWLFQRNPCRWNSLCHWS